MTKSSKVPWPLLTTEAKTMARCVCLTRHLLVPILWPSPAHRAWSVVLLLTSSRPQTSPYISAVFRGHSTLPPASCLGLLFCLKASLHTGSLSSQIPMHTPSLFHTFLKCFLYFTIQQIFTKHPFHGFPVASGSSSVW